MEVKISEIAEKQLNRFKNIERVRNYGVSNKEGYGIFIV